MTNEEMSRALTEELAQAFEDLADELTVPRVCSVTPPAELTSTASFQVHLATGDGTRAEVAIPVNLVIGYLADEEAAVDEWRHWVHEVASRLQSRA